MFCLNILLVKFPDKYSRRIGDRQENIENELLRSEIKDIYINYRGVPCFPQDMLFFLLITNPPFPFSFSKRA